MDKVVYGVLVIFALCATVQSGAMHGYSTLLSDKFETYNYKSSQARAPVLLRFPSNIQSRPQRDKQDGLSPWRSAVGFLMNLQQSKIIAPDATPTRCENDQMHLDMCAYVVMFLPECRMVEWFYDRFEKHGVDGSAVAVQKIIDRISANSFSKALPEIREVTGCGNDNVDCGEFNYERDYSLGGGSHSATCLYDRDCPVLPTLSYCHLQTSSLRSLEGRCKPGASSIPEVTVDVNHWSKRINNYGYTGRGKMTVRWPADLPINDGPHSLKSYLENHPDAVGTIAGTRIIDLAHYLKAGDSMLKRAQGLKAVSAYTYDLLQYVARSDGEGEKSACYKDILVRWHAYGKVLAMLFQRQDACKAFINFGWMGRYLYEGARLNAGCSTSTDCEDYPLQVCQLHSPYRGRCVYPWVNSWPKEAVDSVKVETLSGVTGGKNLVKELKANGVLKNQPFNTFSVKEAITEERTFSYLGAPFECEGVQVLDQQTCGTCWTFAAASAYSMSLCAQSRGRANVLPAMTGFFIRGKRDKYYVTDGDFDVPNGKKHLRHPSNVMGSKEGQGGDSGDAFRSISTSREDTGGVLPSFCRPYKCNKIYWFFSSDSFVVPALVEDSSLKRDCLDHDKVIRMQTDGRSPATYQGAGDMMFARAHQMMGEIYTHLVNSGPLTIQVNMKYEHWADTIGDVVVPRRFPRPGENRHQMVLVGWGTKYLPVKSGPMRMPKLEVLPYWLIQNSWSQNWGEDGYFKVYRGFDVDCFQQQINEPTKDQKCAFDYIVASYFANGWESSTDAPHLAVTTLERSIAVTLQCGACDNGGYMMADCSRCICRGLYSGDRCERCDASSESCKKEGWVFDARLCECRCEEGRFGPDCEDQIEIVLTPSNEVGMVDVALSQMRLGATWEESAAGVIDVTLVLKGHQVEEIREHRLYYSYGFPVVSGDLVLGTIPDARRHTAKAILPERRTENTLSLTTHETVDVKVTSSLLGPQVEDVD